MRILSRARVASRGVRLRKAARACSGAGVLERSRLAWTRVSMSDGPETTALSSISGCRDAQSNEKGREQHKLELWEGKRARASAGRIGAYEEGVGAEREE
eukprot:4975413-Pleurochrysis_carterae.AAC.2